MPGPAIKSAVESRTRIQRARIKPLFESEARERMLAAQNNDAGRAASLMSGQIS